MAALSSPPPAGPGWLLLESLVLFLLESCFLFFSTCSWGGIAAVAESNLLWSYLWLFTIDFFWLWPPEVLSHPLLLYHPSFLFIFSSFLYLNSGLSKIEHLLWKPDDEQNLNLWGMWASLSSGFTLQPASGCWKDEEGPDEEEGEEDRTAALNKAGRTKRNQDLLDWIRTKSSIRVEHCWSKFTCTFLEFLGTEFSRIHIFTPNINKKKCLENRWCIKPQDVSAAVNVVL